MNATQDELGVRKLVEGLVAGWNAHDGTAFARQFATDADFTNVMGLHARGRDVIARGHDEIFATMFRGTTLTATVEGIRFLRPDVAAASVVMALQQKDGNALDVRAPSRASSPSGTVSPGRSRSSTTWSVPATGGRPGRAFPRSCTFEPLLAPFVAVPADERPRVSQRLAAGLQTPAQVSDVTRSGATSILKLFRQTNLDQQLMLANVGAPGLDPYVNGFLSDASITGGTLPEPRTSLQWLGELPSTPTVAIKGLRDAHALTRSRAAGQFTVSQAQRRTNMPCPPLPTSCHTVSRWGLPFSATASMPLTFTNSSPPLWYDEYSVNSAGTAVQDVTQKGYLGQALTGATNLPAQLPWSCKMGSKGRPFPRCGELELARAPPSRSLKIPAR